MKNTLKSITALALCLIVLVACKKGHTHENCEWVADYQGHYLICTESNEKLNVGEHTLDEKHICTACGAKVKATDSKSVKVTTFNELGFEKTVTSYYDSKTVYRDETILEKEGDTYTGYKTYRGDALIEEGKLVKGGEKGYRITETKHYFSDGEYSIDTYDEHEHRTSYITYTKTGKIIGNTRFENTYSENGALIKTKIYYFDKLESEDVYAERPDKETRLVTSVQYSEYGGRREMHYNEEDLIASVKYYDEDGILYSEIKYEYIYDADGILTLTKEYDGDFLAFESVHSRTTYKYADDDTYESKRTNYFRDGTKTIAILNENRDVLSRTEYAANGEVKYKNEYEYAFDDYGNYISVKKYTDGVLSQEEEYTPANDTYKYTRLTKVTRYRDDGSKQVIIYDDNGNITSSTDYDKDGNGLQTTTNTFVYDIIGNTLSRKTHVNGKLVEEYEYSYYANDQTETYLSKTTEYNEDSTKTVSTFDENHNTLSIEEYGENGELTSKITYEYVYDENGEIVLKKSFENSELFEETEYAYVSGNSGRTYEYKTTYYHSDSTKTVYIYDKNDKLLSEEEYDENGLLVSSYTYEYVYDNNGNMIFKKQYENGKLTETSEYAYKTDGSSYTYCFKTTTYGEGLSKQITVYDENGEIDTFVVYEEDGSFYKWTYENGHPKSRTEYDADGNVTEEYIYEYVFDDKNNPISAKIFENGKLYNEQKYSYRSDDPERVYMSETTHYYSDSSKGVNFYNEYGGITEFILYNAEGLVEDRHVYDIEYDNKGNKLHEKQYINGELRYEWEYSYCTDDSDTYISKKIDYESDGGKTVFVLSEDGETISETRYDKNGNVI